MPRAMPPFSTVPPSVTHIAHRRLESTIDQDLGSLSLDSLLTTTISNATEPLRSFASISSIEYPRAFDDDTARLDDVHHPQHTHLTDRVDHPWYGKSDGLAHDTPRPSSRRAVSGQSALSDAESPVSTAGHHVSAVTLGEGVFRTKGGEWESGDEFDPERSLGRLVGQLGKAMSQRVSPRPTSPFSVMSPPRSPRSPSPFSAMQNQRRDLSLTLNRNDPLPSPPPSRSTSGSGEAQLRGKGQSRFTSMAHELGKELRARNVLGESTSHNLPVHAPIPVKGSKLDQHRMKDLRKERRPVSAPVGISLGDVTGMTGLMATPAKGNAHGALGKNTQVGGIAGEHIPESLAALQARLRALETENSISGRRMRELEDELDRARNEVDAARKSKDGRLREVIGEKSALEDLVRSLRGHLARLTAELEKNKALVSELRSSQHHQAIPDSPPRHSRSVTDELAALRREVERLSNEIQRLGGIVEQGLQTRRQARTERSMRFEPDHEDQEMARVREDVERRARIVPTAKAGPSKLRQGLHQAAVDPATLMPPSAEPIRTRSAPTRSVPPQIQTLTPPPTEEEVTPPRPNAKSKASRRSRHLERVEGPASPFPSIRAEDEEEFFNSFEEASIRPATNQTTDTGNAPKSGATKATTARAPVGESGHVPPQTVLARVLRELEDDFAHYKVIYAELADQYKILDAASAVAKRHVLADHLREIIDTLEQKADQIAALYDLLPVQDRPVRPEEMRKWDGVKRSVPDILRTVRDTLGEDAVRRLESEGVRRPRRRHAVV